MSSFPPIVMIHFQHCAKLMNKLTPGKEKKTKLAKGKWKKDKRSSVYATGHKARIGLSL